MSREEAYPGSRVKKGLVILGIEVTTDQLIFYGTLIILSVISLLAGLYLQMKYKQFVEFLNKTSLIALTG